MDKLAAEKEGIFLWCLEGLLRLIANDYRFTISERSKENIAAIVKDANNIPKFLTSEGYLTFHEDSKAVTSDLYAAYKE
jgi:putative DNA primase/helicase